MMKNIKKFNTLFEGGGTDLKSFFSQVLKITSGTQKEFFQWELDNCEVVNITSCKEDEDIMRMVAKSMKMDAPKKNDCYRNAWKICDHCPEFDYVEGQLSLSGIPIDHAWNVHRPTGKHVDVTMEFATKRLKPGDEYLKIATYDIDELYKFSSETGHYGGYLSEAFRQRTNKK